MVAVPTEDLEFIGKLLHEKVVLDIGTGTGASARYFSRFSKKTITVENDPVFYAMALENMPDTVEVVFSDWRIPALADLVFIDCFPYDERYDAASYWFWRGADVWIHDAMLIKSNSQKIQSIGQYHEHWISRYGLVHLGVKDECNI